MQRLFMSKPAVALCLAGSACAAHAGQLDVHFAKDLPAAETQRILEAFDSNLLTQVPAGSTVAVFGDTTPLGSASIPDDEAHRNVAEFRAQVLDPVWFAAEDLLAQAGGAAQDSMASSRAVDFVEVLNRLRYVETQGRDVVIVGSPLLHDPRMPDASLKEGWPNDAVFGMAPDESPYGTRGVPQLQGLRVHFCLVMDEPFTDLMHEKNVERTIGLVTQGWGATLATYTTDLSLCFDRAAKGIDIGAPHYERDLSVQTPAMLVSSTTLVAPASRQPDQQAMLDSLAVDEAEKAAIREAIDADRLRLAHIWLSDAQTADGDIVAFDFAGIQVPVTLETQEREAVVGVHDGKIVITALKDGGGGGVTLMLRTEDDQIVTPILQPGETVAVPVAVH